MRNRRSPHFLHQVIVTTSVVLGTLLPLLLNRLRVDAAHASTSIQVIMDVLGVLITCTVAPRIFELAAAAGPAGAPAALQLANAVAPSVS